VKYLQNLNRRDQNFSAPPFSVSVVEKSNVGQTALCSCLSQMLQKRSQ
jgi:hypothetical protein